jgi:hypothetical protein
MESNMTDPQKNKKRLPYDPVIPLLCIYSKEWAPGYDRPACTPMFTAALFTIAKLRNQPTYTTTE